MATDMARPKHSNIKYYASDFNNIQNRLASLFNLHLVPNKMLFDGVKSKTHPLGNVYILSYERGNKEIPHQTVPID